MCNFSKMGFNLLKILEGCKLEAYQDSGGIWTIGFGQTGDVKKGDKITQEKAELLLHMYILSLEPKLKKLIKVPINQNQYDALVIFVYNIGLNAFKCSTMLSLINKNEFIKASEQFKRWSKDSKGNISEGLLRRREIEYKLYLKK